jgi:hypothetical protein
MPLWRPVEDLGHIVALRSTRGDVPGEGRIWDGLCACGEIGIVTDRQLIEQKSQFRWGAKRPTLHCGGPAHHPLGRVVARAADRVARTLATIVGGPAR